MVSTLPTNSRSGHHCTVGASSSWSVTPLLNELHRLHPRNVKVLNTPPQKLAEQLKKQTTDLSICPTSTLLDHSGLELALPIGEAMRGGLGLCYLAVTAGHPDEVSDLYLRLEQFKKVCSRLKCKDVKSWSEGLWRWSREMRWQFASAASLPYLRYSGESNSWSHFARLLYRLLYGESAYTGNQASQTRNDGFACGCESHPILKQGQHHSTLKLELKCGNPGLVNRCRYQHVIDLSELWFQSTRLPFVASVALKKRRPISSVIHRNAILMATDLAQAKMRIDPSSYFPDIVPANYVGHSIDLGSIWRQVYYRLGGEDVKSLRLFLHFLRPLNESVVSEESFHSEMMRWQHREAEGIFEQ